MKREGREKNQVFWGATRPSICVSPPPTHRAMEIPPHPNRECKNPPRGCAQLPSPASHGAIACCSGVGPNGKLAEPSASSIRPKHMPNIGPPVLSMASVPARTVRSPLRGAGGRREGGDACRPWVAHCCGPARSCAGMGCGAGGARRPGPALHTRRPPSPATSRVPRRVARPPAQSVPVLLLDGRQQPPGLWAQQGEGVGSQHSAGERGPAWLRAKRGRNPNTNATQHPFGKKQAAVTRDLRAGGALSRFVLSGHDSSG